MFSSPRTHWERKPREYLGGSFQIPKWEHFWHVLGPARELVWLELGVECGVAEMGWER